MTTMMKIDTPYRLYNEQVKKLNSRTFVLKHPHRAETEEITVNGIKQHRDHDYYIAGDTILFITSPALTDKILVSYDVQLGVQVERTW